MHSFVIMKPRPMTQGYGSKPAVLFCEVVEPLGHSTPMTLVAHHKAGLEGDTVSDPGLIPLSCPSRYSYATSSHSHVELRQQ